MSEAAAQLGKRSMAEEIAELRALPVSELIKRFRELYGREPRCKNKDYLWRRCAHCRQTNRFGGLSKLAKEKLEVLIAELDFPIAEESPAVRAKLEGRSGELKPGMTLVRDWRGRRLQVRVRDGGQFEFEAAIYSSLSAVAQKATGSHWNGRLFFGLTARKKKAKE